MSAEIAHDLASRFRHALKNLGARAPVDHLFNELKNRYAEPARHYHTISHVRSCLTWLDECHTKAERPAEAEIALWFHDAVYDPGGSRNEEDSAELAKQRLGELGVRHQVAERVAGLIMATEGHDCAAGDAALVVSVDLAILGSPPEKYRAFEKQIRSEYSHIPDAVFQSGRKKVLRRFLRRPAIYPIRWFRDRLEATARKNLERRIRDHV